MLFFCVRSVSTGQLTITQEEEDGVGNSDEQVGSGGGPGVHVGGAEDSPKPQQQMRSLSCAQQA